MLGGMGRQQGAVERMQSRGGGERGMSVIRGTGDHQPSMASLSSRMRTDTGYDDILVLRHPVASLLTDRPLWEELPAAEIEASEESAAAKLKISILMCAFNEVQTITQAVRELLQVDYPCEIELIVVDDGSTDGTAALVERFKDPRIILCRHPENRGKGAALRTAASLASGTHILPFDADLEYSPKDIPNLVEPVLTGRFDVVYGVRLFGCNTVYHSFRYAVGNKMLTTLTNMLYDSYLNDMHTCLKLMPLTTFRGFALRENGFGLDTEVTVCLLRMGLRPFEVPVSYYSRSHAQGKKINWRDAFSCLHILLRVRTTRKRNLWARVALADSNGDAPMEPTAISSRSQSDTRTNSAALDVSELASAKPNPIAAG